MDFHITKLQTEFFATRTSRDLDLTVKNVMNIK